MDIGKIKKRSNDMRKAESNFKSGKRHVSENTSDVIENACFIVQKEG